MAKSPKDYALEINGAKYFTVERFARVTNRTQQNVRHLMAQGNRVRRLRSFYLAGKPFVPYEELTEFPFTSAGRPERIYHYDATGHVVESPKVEVAAEVAE
jgi:hypothetical protein